MNEKGICEAKILSLTFRVQGLQQAIGQRISALTTIGSIAIGGASIIVATGGANIRYPILLRVSLILLAITTLGSLGFHLFALRKGIKDHVIGIIKLRDANWIDPPPSSIPKLDYLLEFFYLLLVAGVILFGLSIF
jgi:hypothetical protein